jgi:hypothetical protein
MPAETPAMDVALALLREVKDRMTRVEDKLDEIAEGRRKDAQVHGALEVRVTTLEDSHLWVKGILAAVVAGLIIAAVGKFWR